ncbi:cation diffusion facilitator CzcD-associated flavoprotein CzcO [Bradyrhizobium sp. cir1]|uniref:NAD(P)-binding domain-containing protein n=1 Tax=Bradyrhizobium sp. cir1 TaxID=1445730 RepID=UPI0016059065|nr:NAD(P)-binding domain-containing protein [Bradyrhizobium sp. cir1]MBB4370458.1 cation diffusion facilitator CzcD-associated flavoprotein CzcO [Bradyrhizobium sp. cir1]
MDSLSPVTVCIIGAGPYGISVAAHLQSRGIEFRIFGISMHRWRAQMPIGMFLKSEGCASNLSDPIDRHTLRRYCAEEKLPYEEWGQPVSREVFVRYALSFQRTLVPNVESAIVTMVSKSNNGFRLELSSGERLNAEKVIIATGLEHMAHTPQELGRLPAHLQSHSERLHDLSQFRGKDVTVIGGGQSALETAVLLHETGAFVRLLVRKPSLRWNPPPRNGRRSLYRRLWAPRTGLGDGLQLWLYSNLPDLFRYLPQWIRLERAKNVLGPTGAWWLNERTAGLPILLGHSLLGAEARGDRAVLQVSDQNGRSDELVTDHVIAATGYSFQLGRLPFLSQDLVSRLRHEQQLPMLSSHFESSVPGLYFTGLASAYSFGPAMRFLHGASFTSRTIAQQIASAERDNRLVPAIQPAGIAKYDNLGAGG